MKLHLTLTLMATLVLPGMANAQYLLDTGVPTSSAGPVLLSSAQSYAGEFTATAGTDVTQLGVYLTHGIGNNIGSATNFIFDLYSGSIIGRTNSATEVLSVVGTYDAGTWSTATGNWVLPTTCNYWLVVQTDGTGLVNQFDLPQETSSSTGTKPAIAFAVGGGLGFSTSGAAPVGFQVVAAPEPSAWAFMLGGFGALLFFIRRRHRS